MRDVKELSKVQNVHTHHQLLQVCSLCWVLDQAAEEVQTDQDVLRSVANRWRNIVAMLLRVLPRTIYSQSLEIQR